MPLRVVPLEQQANSASRCAR